MASGADQLAMARRIGSAWPDHRVDFHLLDLARTDRALGAVHCRWRSGFKRRVLHANRSLLESMDALVVPERTSAALRHHPELDHVQLVLIPHGAGDRAVGYEGRNALFDLLLVPGEKCRQRLIRETNVDAGRVHVIGYPKFEVPLLDDPPELFPVPRPTVLYNPHFDPRYSSWPKMGTQVLDYFAAQSEFNLIFAPHVMLYERPARHRARPLTRYRNLPHIHLDLGSDRCVDMTYTRRADIYLGDVSSQIYEFVVKPRPAVFLNAHDVRSWRDDANFQHWSMGTVLDSVDGLGAALRQPLSPAASSRQRCLTARTFHSEATPPSKLGALRLLEHLAARDRRVPAPAGPVPRELAGAAR